MAMTNGKKHASDKLPDPKLGSAAAGAVFNPAEESARRAGAGETETAVVRAAPAPGVPMSLEQFEELKRMAECGTANAGKPGQRDPSAKK
jgi:hypothetical protein